MENFLPATFLEFLGGVMAVVAVCAGLGSLNSILRAHLVKMLAIFIICSLALFSNSVSTYFVAVFVVATAVTELDFLQNLAAIIRGNKEYFDYRKEQLTKERRLGSLATEVEEADILASTSPEDKDEICSSAERGKPVVIAAAVQGVVAAAPKAGAGEVAEGADMTKKDKEVPVVEVDSDESEVVIVKNTVPNVSSFSITPKVKRIFEYESRALDKLEGFYGAAIERGLRLVSKGGVQVELDGLMVGSSRPDTIFEIKYLSSSKNFISWIGLVSLQLHRTRSLYLQITKKSPLIHFVLVLEDGVALTSRQKTELVNVSADTYSIYTPSMLGFKG